MDVSKYPLLYNAAAHFKVLERYPDGLTTEMAQEGYDGFEAVCWAFAELAVQGELARRDMGYDKQKIPTQAHFLAQVKITEVLEIKNAILLAISKGLSSPEDEDAEIDEILAEEQKKTEIR